MWKDGVHSEGSGTTSFELPREDVKP